MLQVPHRILLRSLWVLRRKRFLWILPLNLRCFKRATRQKSIFHRFLFPKRFLLPLLLLQDWIAVKSTISMFLLRAKSFGLGILSIPALLKTLLPLLLAPCLLRLFPSDSLPQPSPPHPLYLLLLLSPLFLPVLHTTPLYRHLLHLLRISTRMLILIRI